MSITQHKLREEKLTLTGPDLSDADFLRGPLHKLKQYSRTENCQNLISFVSPPGSSTEASFPDNLRHGARLKERRMTHQGPRFSSNKSFSDGAFPPWSWQCKQNQWQYPKHSLLPSKHEKHTAINADSLSSSSRS